MLRFEDYTLPCALLSGSDSAEGSSFIRTQWDFGTRQRAVQRGYVTAQFNLLLTHPELISFKQFYSDLFNGSQAFNYSGSVHGNDNLNKIIRFTAPFLVSPVGNNIFKVSTAIEMINKGTPRSESCPKMPYNTLYPNDTNLPC